MHALDQQLKSKLLTATEEVQAILSSVEGLSIEQARIIIKRYVAAVEGNFLPWMAAASITVRSPLSKFATDENLWVEIKEDHPGMLRRFAISCQAEPNSEDFSYVQREVIRIRHLTSELSGLKNITLMAVLENTSVGFIPFLAQLGKKSGCTDFTYTDVHGEADILHANQFLEALTEEQSLGYENPEKAIDETISLAKSLLIKVFKV